MKDADLAALPLFRGSLEALPLGYHLRPEGKPCPRGHRALFRDSRKDCAKCRRIAARSWRVTEKTGRAIATGRPIPNWCAYVIGASAAAIRAFLLEGCQRAGVAPEDYGRTWGIYHKQPIALFALETTAGLRAANRLENLFVDSLHNAPKHGH